MPSVLPSSSGFLLISLKFFFQAEDGIRDLVRSRGLGDVYKRQSQASAMNSFVEPEVICGPLSDMTSSTGVSSDSGSHGWLSGLSLIHI